VTAERVLSQEELAALIDDALDPSWAGLSHRPLPSVLDTDFIRTGLHYQLSNGIPPRSVRTARDGSLRLFMEYDTLAAVRHGLADRERRWRVDRYVQSELSRQGALPFRSAG
jgi:hypothetical protein